MDAFLGLRRGHGDEGGADRRTMDDVGPGCLFGGMAQGGADKESTKARTKEEGKEGRKDEKTRTE